MKQCTVMYSGGTDSVAATTLIAEQFDRIHLVTYKHSGISHVNNSRYHLNKLGELYGADKFKHMIINVDRLFKAVTYARYAHNVRHHGFFNLTTCGLCKLAMHLRTLIYCLDNGIDVVVDGANKHSSHFPAQMKEVIDELRALYAHFGIDYQNPVFDYEVPDNLDWFHKMGLAALTAKHKPAKRKQKNNSAGQLLYEQGILDRENVKGTATDRCMQPRCLQLTLLNLFAFSYFIPKFGMEAYREKAAVYYREKIGHFRTMIEKYVADRNGSEIEKWIGGAST